MNRLQQLFQNKKKDILSIYYTAGYPNLNDTLQIAEALEKAGADFLEIGFPYSDPVADGPIIQASSKQSLDQGMTLQILFSQLKDLRKTVTIPILLMGYVNPVLQFGVENFCKACAEIGIDGCIIPDLPMYEYEELYHSCFEEHGVSNIFLVTPQTSEERIRKIDGLSNAFIYLLSSAATTGKNLDVSANARTYFARIKAMDLKNPLMIGFGISDKQTFDAANEYASGAIIGSAFVKCLANGDVEKNVKTFMKEFRN
ncbi:tryptophan synthase subunit alpha [Pedobacter boryungensis]|uniref:Tryptophan synthase alpha chain n=1 Tax=Pedobacter boryungensis TaxID=869962 RepID=A0ABX2D8Q9_9SPHI|nr:tryptophan synthase subunit alpha [Pedobacter boryungensis]NQX30451.1 tryptophan synthase subunit alpha [Pedobacter boryungensis]